MKQKFVLLAGMLVMTSLHVFSQSPEWRLINGQAVAEKKFVIPGKSARDLYKEIHRWLIRKYENPEDIIKARVEDEYLRGVGYNSKFMKSIDHVSPALRYVFSFDVKDEEVTFKIFDAVLIDSNLQDNDAEYPIEDYFNSGNRGTESNEVLISASAFSASMFQTLETALILKN
jgi:hypothetical protein